MAKRPVILHCASLEEREVPAALVYPNSSFDDSSASLPTNWTAWTSGSGQAIISEKTGRNNSNSLVLTGASNSVIRAWDERVTSANVEVNASVQLNSLIPAQVFARGSNLSSSEPTYYAAGISRGSEITLNKVVQGVTTNLATIKTNQYFSNLWVNISLAVQGNRLQVRVQQPETGQWLNKFGFWQSSPTEAIDGVDSDIKTAGLVGLNRPVSYSGGVTLDNFRSNNSTGDVTPPDVKILFPTLTAKQLSSGAQGYVKVSAEVKDQSAISRTDFLLDGELIARRDQSPFRIDVDSRNFLNGSHTISVRVWDAAGNTTETVLPLSISNPSSVQSTEIKRHFSHIRYASLAYSGTPMDETTNELLKNNVDLVVPNPNYLNTINNVSPETPQLIYSNVSNLYLDLLTDWLNFADAKKTPRENAFYHVSTPTPFSGNSPSSLPVNRFWNVAEGGANQTSYTSASQQSKPYSIPLGGTGRSLVVGYPDRFREINLGISKVPDRSWRSVVEYPTIVDANGKPIAWNTLNLVTNTTGGLRQSGQITFNPPANWKPAVVAGSTARLFYVRIRTIAGTAESAPILISVTGRDFVNAKGTTSGTIPVFDKLADKDGNGYLTDAEYAKRRSGMDARFLYESRVFYPYYGQMRFLTNPGGDGVAAWAVDYHQRVLRRQPLADGIMMDNSGGKIPNTQTSLVEQTDTYTYDYASLLGQISRAIAPKKILANTAGGGASASKVDQQVAGSLEEFSLRPLQHTWAQFEGLSSEISNRLSKLSDGKFLILDTLSAGGGSPTDPRTRMSALAYYYLLADPKSTMLMTWGGEEPNSAWSRHWFDAIGYDIGQPQGAWSTAATGADPSNNALTYELYARQYDNALVLYKPRSYKAGVGTGTINDDTATTHQLDGNYRVLNSDGTLGEVTNTISIRNGEGIVLIRSSSNPA